MRRMKNLFCGLGMLALLAGPAIAGSKPNKVAITSTSAKAAVIIKAEDVPISYPYQTSYRISLRGYDPEKQSLASGGTLIEAKPKLFADGYLVAEIKPGRYVFQDFSRQDRWALCFYDNSLQFEVKAGEILYLGEIDSKAHVAELEFMAITTGRVTSQNSEAIHFFDNVTAPMLKPIDDSALSAVAAMMKKHLPLSTVAPKPALLSAARFGTGSDLFGLNRVCGGYFSKKAKTEKPPKS
jgi:hypothetical protein